MGKGKGTRPNRTLAYQSKLRIAEIEAQGQQDIMRDLVRFVGEDIRSQLLIVALTGTSLATLLGAYEKVKTENAALPEPIPTPPLWSWFLVGGLGTVISVEVVSKLFDQTKLVNAQNSNNPYALIGSLAAAATTTSGLAWAALMASLILGEGGLGGVLEKAGGGGFGAIASTAVL